MDRVKDKVIVITGAASGLGLADSRVLAGEGAQVVMTDIDPESGQAHANEIGAHFITQDVSEEVSWQKVMGEVESHFGRLDGLVNNAGIAPIANIEDTTTDVWRRVMGIHLDATFLGVSVSHRADEEKAAAVRSSICPQRRP
jgi:3(or 17)beta-hydroxysteroid dehydrogenase